MQILVKAALILAIVFTATAVGKKLPSLGGLIAVMPLTGALVLVWMYYESEGNQGIMESFAKGAVLGILPSILFFLIAYYCIKKGLSLPAVIGSSFGAWLAAALLHQWLVGR